MASNDNNNSNNDNEYYVGIAAIVISTLALFGVVLQYLQTIVATANGLPNRSKDVMGLWAPYTRIRWGFFHVEVEYQSPIIFVASNDNLKGPLEGQPWYVDGTAESCHQTRVEEPPPDPEFGRLPGLTRERVHTVKNELATWILAISAAQKMERDSLDWEQHKWRRSGMPFPEASFERTKTRNQIRASLAVNIMPITRSFDKHPAMRKPFATTAICHIIELCAILGIYWKEFDRDNNKYRAEGNGYSVLGSRVSDFGIVFTFEKPGWPRYQKNRVIPTSEVKELCFGNVPTFYRSPEEDDHWRQPINEQTSLKTLQLGSRAEIAETLNLIRCNEYTTRCYSDPSKKHTHLFPVIFEVLGMLARPLHIINRPFTYLPNPIIFPLNKQAFSLRRLLKEFSERLDREVNSSNTYPHPDKLRTITARAVKLNSDLPPHQDGDYSPQHLNELHHAIDLVDKSVLSEDQNTKEVVLDVLRRHVQEVLLAINTSLDSDSFDSHFPVHRPGYSAGSMGGGPQRSGTHAAEIIKGEISFDDLLKVPHEQREASLMEKYFEEICLRVVSTSSQHHDQPAVTASVNIHREFSTLSHDSSSATGTATGLGLGSLQEETASPASLPVVANGAGPGEEANITSSLSSPELSQTQSNHQTQSQSTPRVPPSSASEAAGHGVGVGSFPSRRNTASSIISRSETWRRSPPTQAEVRRHTIWCALMFRMICWLLLHDFDKKDKQLPKSELMGSRLSVFIV
ncbi:hypothetical protein V8F20_012537 [Naviculisporaceae sp. PSN 640]